MSLVDKPFKEAIRGLPTKKLSWWADRRIKKMIRFRAAELDGKSVWSDFFKQLVAVPMALVLLITVTGGYAYASPTVVKGDLLYSVKMTIENARYPRDGSSEDRIAYHLWLSERRYAEVNEILVRLGKEPLALIPAAHAANAELSADAELNQILLETLQSATQNVDYAFLISDEIRDVQRVKSVQQQIRGSLEKQKEFVKKVSPILKEVKLQERKKARVKKQPIPPTMELKISSESSTELEAPAVVPEPSSEPLEAEPVAPSETFSMESEAMVESEPEEDLADVGDFLEDRVAYQNALLEKIDEVVVEANTNGFAVVRLTIHLQALEDEPDTTNDFFREALAVHYQNSERVLETEIVELDQEVAFQAEQNIVPQPASRSSFSEHTEQDFVPSVPAEVTPEPVFVPEVVPPAADPVPVEKTEPLPEPTPVVPLVEETLEDEVKMEIPAPLERDPVASEPTAPAVSSDISTSSSSEVTVPPPATPPVEVRLKTTCELKAEEICIKSDQKICSERVIKECEEQLKQDRERAERERLQREALERADNAKRELEGLRLRMEKLQLNLRNSPGVDVKISEQIPANILKGESTKDRRDDGKERGGR